MKDFIKKLKNFFRKKYRINRYKRNKFWNNAEFPTLLIFIPFLFWKLKDFIKSLKIEKGIHLYGIYGYFGLPGQGKTMAMSRDLLKLRKKYNNQIYIFTNYGFFYEDKPFDDVNMLFKTYDKPVIFAWDEVQNEFNSRNYSKFPIELLTLLTQNRKGHGKRILYTAQRFSRVDKVFRELSVKCAECKTLFGRLTSVRWYHWESYETLSSSSNENSRMRVRSDFRDIFIQSDKLRSCYNSYQMLQTAADKIKDIE